MFELANVRKRDFLAALLAAGAFIIGVLGLASWLTNGTSGSGGAAEDFGTSAWFTAIVVGVLTLTVFGTSVYLTQHWTARVRQIQGFATGLLVVLIFLTLNSLGAWLLPAGVLAIVAWLLGRR
jgi:hypothetical protein